MKALVLALMLTFGVLSINEPLVVKDKGAIDHGGAEVYDLGPVLPPVIEVPDIMVAKGKHG